MLINSTHATTTKGQIPPELLDVYVRYKQDTRAIIAWLLGLSHGRRKPKRHSPKTISIRDLVRLVETLRAKKEEIVMPEPIDFCFRKAIAARTRLSEFFRESKPKKARGDDDAGLNRDDDATGKHEFFTESLAKIYTDLCECCARPKESCKTVDSSYRPPSSSSASTDDETVLVNRFTVLDVKEIRDEPDCIEKPSDCECEDDGGENSTTNLAPTSTPQLIDDTLGDAFEIHKDIQEMSDLLLATNSVWEEAARAETPIVMAAFITNTAFAIFEAIEQRLQSLCNGSNPDRLRSKLMPVEEGLETSDNVEINTSLGKAQQVEALQRSWQLLLRFKRVRQARADEQAIHMIMQKPLQAVLRRGPNSAEKDHECLTMMLQNIGHHVQCIRRPTSIVRLGSPVYADVGYFFTHQENDTNGLRCSYGLQILLEAYKSYLLASDCAYPPPNCRLQALKFAQAALPSIGAVLDDKSMPCRCCHTLAFHLENIQLDFQTFVKERVFDLYFQSPWVSGSHMLEMLETLFYYGLRLFSYRHYVGAVLHVYNVLKQLTGFHRIPLLEELCNTFNDILFPGGRPKRNFRGCCVRYMGGRLRFDPQASHHRSGSHQMAIPTHTAKAAAGFGLRKEANDARFDYAKVSLFYHIKQKDYHLDKALWDRVYDVNDVSGGQKPAKGRKRHSCCHHHTWSDMEVCSSSPQQRLVHLQQAVMNDFSGTFPIAKINFFEVYLSCIRIISLISDNAHGENGKGQYCLCFLDAILSAADLYKDNEHRLQPFGSRDLVQTCKDAMNTVVGGRSLEDYLWKEL